MFRHRVGEFIKLRGLTYSKFARAAGVGMRTAKELYEDPCCQMNTITLYKCCVFFGVQPSELLVLDKAELQTV